MEISKEDFNEIYNNAWEEIKNECSEELPCVGKGYN